MESAIKKKVSHAVDLFQHSPRKQSYIALDRKSSSDTEESDTETQDFRKTPKRERKESSSTLSNNAAVKSSQRRETSSNSSSNNKKSKKKKHTTIEEDLANSGFKVSPKMIAVANISKKHSLRNETIMLGYINVLSEQLCAQEQEIQLLSAQVKQLQNAQRQKELYDAQRKLQEEVRLQQTRERNSGCCASLKRLLSTEETEDEECVLF